MIEAIPEHHVGAHGPVGFTSTVEVSNGVFCFQSSLRACLHGGEPVRLRVLARLAEMNLSRVYLDKNSILGI